MVKKEVEMKMKNPKKSKIFGNIQILGFEVFQLFTLGGKVS